MIKVNGTFSGEGMPFLFLSPYSKVNPKKIEFALPEAIFYL